METKQNKAVKSNHTTYQYQRALRMAVQHATNNFISLRHFKAYDFQHYY